jgi:DNA (cytosine-5)-methyltransferase 1
MTFGSLFAGIGGMDLGLERAGMTCRWQVEINDYARRVLAKHWPGVPRWDDIRTFPPLADAERERIQSRGEARDMGRQTRAGEGNEGQWQWDGQAIDDRGSAFGPVDLICGGFPCQDISYAGRGAGLAGERSGLWYEFARVVRTLRPRFVLVENVAAILTRGLDAVLGTLAANGYDCEYACIPAAAADLIFRLDKSVELPMPYLVLSALPMSTTTSRIVLDDGTGDTRAITLWLKTGRVEAE